MHDFVYETVPSFIARNNSTYENSLAKTKKSNIYDDRKQKELGYIPFVVLNIKIN